MNYNLKYSTFNCSNLFKIIQLNEKNNNFLIKYNRMQNNVIEYNNLKILSILYSYKISKALIGNFSKDDTFDIYNYTYEPSLNSIYSIEFGPGPFFGKLNNLISKTLYFYKKLGIDTLGFKIINLNQCKQSYACIKFDIIGYLKKLNINYVKIYNVLNKYLIERFDMAEKVYKNDTICISPYDSQNILNYELIRFDKSKSVNFDLIKNPYENSYNSIQVFNQNMINSNIGNSNRGVSLVSPIRDRNNDRLEQNSRLNDRFNDRINDRYINRINDRYINRYNLFPNKRNERNERNYRNINIENMILTNEAEERNLKLIIQNKTLQHNMIRNNFGNLNDSNNKKLLEVFNIQEKQNRLINELIQTNRQINDKLKNNLTMKNQNNNDDSATIDEDSVTIDEIV